MTKNLTFLFLLISATCFAQTFPGSGGSIPDNGPAINFPVAVSGLNPAVLDSSFGVQSVCVDISHNNLYQLTLQLIAPDGTVIDLSMNNGGTGNNYSSTCFSGNASTPVTSGSAPFNGTYRPQGILGNVNNGQTGNGIWSLRVQDQNFGTTGTLNWWSITFSNTPSYPFIFSSSNLPIVVINTNGQTIVDDPKKIVHMGIIDNGPGVRNYLSDPYNNYDGNIAIEIRGSWSQTFPQKQYGFETLDSTNTEADASILGMPAESDWILNAPYNDKSCMRNALVYEIANKTGHYASRSRFCELVINNDYKGIYVMLEKVKRDSNRVDISKLTPTDTAGADLTGGYIVKLDKNTGSGGGGWASDFDGFPGSPVEFMFEYPSDDDIMPQQAAYIQAYVDSFEHALNANWFANLDSGYAKYIDVNSFIDFFILNESCKNVDAYRNSTFLYKKKITKGNKLFVGPAWDYNIAFWNADYCGGNSYTGWQYQFNSICGNSIDNMIPFWWARFLQDPIYTQTLKCRWIELRQDVLNTDTLFARIDTLAAYLDEAKNRHFTKWPIMGVPVWANPQPVATSYAGEIANMKTYIQQRLSWLDNNLPGICPPSGITDISPLQPLTVYPNPFTDQLSILIPDAASGTVHVTLYDLAGRTAFRQSITTDAAGPQLISITPPASIVNGMYLLTATAGSHVYKTRVVKK